MNGKEGELGPFDHITRRWVFGDGRTRIKVRPECLEVIGGQPKASLASAFHAKAQEYQYPDAVRNQFVFDRIYSLAADEGQPGVAVCFRQIRDNETVFDFYYGRMES